ncbi:MAG TPA: hypothetical protein VG937_17100 [Polyangiaceae bacterium]|nr:hypothetical protein [Polyangiaceae bacterium]
MRILVVLTDADAGDVVRQRFAALLSEHHVLAACKVAPELTSFPEGLETQRRISTMLRYLLGAPAENIAVFAISGRLGDSVEDCAREWGAAEVRR